MKNKLFALLSTVALALPVSANATPRAIDNGLMVYVPNVGLSRIETVTFCLNEGGVDNYQDLITDSDFVNFERCLIEMT
jgi:hypothetical protein